ncbi:MAG: hypothetical protein V4704_04720 [Pseudomonadota bacterium]
MNKKSLLLAVSLLVSLSACRGDAPSAPVATSTGADYQVRVWPLPAEAGGMAPDLSVAPDGRLLLSWINRQQGRRNALQFSSYTLAGGWQSQPRTVAVGEALVANWADTPHMLGTPDGALWVQWLQGSAAGPAAYDTVLARSRDGGQNWTQLTRVNDDQGAAEHGFAALWANGADALGIAWLDGRAQAATHDGGQHAPGMMQLRANRFDPDLARGVDAVVDASVCDCCQVDVAISSTGPVLAYRDRTEAEIRDIAVVRLQGGAWSEPKIVHADGWKIPGCPVNGPAIAARQAGVVVGWYSEGSGLPTFQLARSNDGGTTFGAPVVVEQGANVLGRVDVALDATQAWVSWLRDVDGAQALMLARYTPDLSRQLQRIEVARLQARGRASGMPKLAVDANGAWLVWTDVEGGVPQLRGAQVTR